MSQKGDFTFERGLAEIPTALQQQPQQLLTLRPGLYHLRQQHLVR